jgi:hypothetical protein
MNVDTGPRMSEKGIAQPAATEWRLSSLALEDHNELTRRARALYQVYRECHALVLKGRASASASRIRGMIDLEPS